MSDPTPLPTTPLALAVPADQIIRQPIGMAELTTLIGVSSDWFSRARRALEEQGFPTPLFPRSRPMLWDPLAVRLWMDARLPGAAKLGPEEAKALNLEETLRRRSEKIAAGLGRRS